MGSVFSGWWSSLVAIWTAALVFISVTALFGEAEDRGLLARVALALVMLGFAAVTAAALVVRRRTPKLAAWLLAVGVGLPGIGFFWMLFIPTAIALVIIVGGVTTGEVTFRRPKLVGAGTG